MIPTIIMATEISSPLVLPMRVTSPKPVVETAKPLGHHRRRAFLERVRPARGHAGVRVRHEGQLALQVALQAQADGQ